MDRRVGGRREKGANAGWNVLLPHGLSLLGSSAEKVDDASSCMDSRYSVHQCDYYCRRSSDHHAGAGGGA